MAQGRSVLVVDDDQSFREALAAALHAQGFGVIEAADGSAALACLRRPSRPAVVVLDVVMPGVDGAAFRRAQLSDPQLAHVPVILCSGEKDLGRRAERLGIRDYVMKPVDLDRMVALLRSHTYHDGPPSGHGPSPRRRPADRRTSAR